MSNVFVLDTQMRPLDPVHPGHARLLLKHGRAAVYRRYPFTIILKVAVEQPVRETLRLKLDPGSKVSNLVAACTSCNQRKSNQDIREFLQEQPERLARILAQLKTPLRDTAAVNVTRWALFDRLKALGLPIECSSSGRTKYNRVMRGLPKTHWLDAACVGASTPELFRRQASCRCAVADCSYGATQPTDVPHELLWLSRQGAQGDQRRRGHAHR